jgi:hypothetical protein
VSTTASPSPIRELLTRLGSRTQTRGVDWDDQTTDFAGENFRTRVGHGVVTVGVTSRALDDSDYGQAIESGYKLTVLNEQGLVVLARDYYEGDADFALVKALFDAARLNARSGDEVIGSMLADLGE